MISIETPFDDVAVSLSNLTLSLGANADTKLRHLETFIQICMVRYLQMKNTSLKSWDYHQAIIDQQLENRSISIKELLDHSLIAIEVKLNYFGFIEELNRYGAVFEAEGTTIPDFNRIKFYRNKMIEHWSGYEEYLHTNGNGYTFKKDTLIIPFHFGAINSPPISQQVYKKLYDQLLSLGVTLPPLGLELTVDDQYSDIVYCSLEKIDPKLRREKIPDSIVNTLFAYRFPIPITNLEDYISRLNVWIKYYAREYLVQ